MLMVVVAIRVMTTPNLHGGELAAAPLAMTAQLSSGVYLRLLFAPEVGLLRVHAWAKDGGFPYELDWPSLELYMMTGMVMHKEGRTIQFSPTDIYEMTGFGWQLLMRHGVVPVEWHE